MSETDPSARRTLPRHRRRRRRCRRPRRRLDRRRPPPERPDLGRGPIVTAEECLDGDEGVTATLPDGRSVPAELAGRDPSTDVALLRAETGPQPDWPAAAAPAVGALALAVGRGGDGPIAAFGIVAVAGPAWTSAAGGRIDARLRLSFPLPPRSRAAPRSMPRGASSASPSPTRAGARW